MCIVLSLILFLLLDGFTYSTGNNSFVVVVVMLLVVLVSLILQTVAMRKIISNST